MKKAKLSSAIYSFVLMVLLAAAIPVGAQTASIHVDNFAQINDSYYRGAQPQGQDYADLATLGVKTVINLQSDDADIKEKGFVETTGMKYLQIPMTTHQPPSAAQIAEFLKIVNDPASQPVFVHCAGGRHRTGVMTAIYRMTQNGWTADQAFKEMKQYKYGADFLHPEFKSFVFDYQRQLARAQTTPQSIAPAKTTTGTPAQETVPSEATTATGGLN